MEGTTHGPVTNKYRMYQLLEAGVFGNTVRHWSDVNEWWEDVGWKDCRCHWAVRSKLKSDKRRLFLDLTNWRVLGAVTDHYSDGTPYDISPVYNHLLTLRADVMVSPVPPFGLRVLYTHDKELRSGWRECHGLEARLLLERHLWPSDLEGLKACLENFPDHVVEISAFSRAVGVIPNRNTCVWEVRAY